VDVRIVKPRKGRGAASNDSGRYEPERRLAFDDGWGTVDEEPPRLETEVTAERSRSIISQNDSPDVPFDRSINPYKGCEHGCVYCFARPTHAYLGLSPGLDFESRIVHKPDGPELLRRTFDHPRYQPQLIAVGANTDPYQPVERKLGLTRRLLEVFRDYRHPVGIITKSNLVLRDLDLLADLAGDRLAHVFVSVTTLDRALARRMEPRAPTPARRLDAVRALADAGVPVGVLVSPVVPGLTDHELERILEAAAKAGAGAASYLVLRLPMEIKDLFDEWLDAHYPDRKKRVMDLIRGMRGGALYDARFGVRMRGTGPHADMIARRYGLAARRLGLDGGLPPLDSGRFTRPPKPEPQLCLFPSEE